MYVLNQAEENELFAFLSTPEALAEEAAQKARIAAEYTRCLNHYHAMFSDQTVLNLKAKTCSIVYSVALRHGRLNVLAALQAAIDGTCDGAQQGIIDELLLKL